MSSGMSHSPHLFILTPFASRSDDATVCSARNLLFRPYSSTDILAVVREIGLAPAAAWYQGLRTWNGATPWWSFGTNLKWKWFLVAYLRNVLTTSHQIFVHLSWGIIFHNFAFLEAVPNKPLSRKKVHYRRGSFKKTVLSKYDCPTIEQKQEANFPIFQRQSYVPINSLASTYFLSDNYILHRPSHGSSEAQLG